MQDNLFCLVLGVALLATLPGCARSPRFRVALLHNAGWGAALLIVGSGLIAYDSVSLRTMGIFVSSIVLFNAATALGYGRTSSDGSGDDGLRVTLAKAQRAPIVSVTVYRLLTIGFILGICVYVVRMASLFGLETLLTDPSSIRGSQTIKYMEQFPLYGKLLVYLGPLCFVLTVFPWLVDRKKPSRRAVRVAAAAVIILLQAALLQRTNIFVCLLWAAGVALIQSKSDPNSPRIPMRKYLAFGLLALVLFQGLALALGKTGTENSAITSTVGGRLAGSQATGVLVYASSGVLGFDKLVRSHNVSWPPMDSESVVYGDYNPPTNGLATFSAITSKLPISPNWQEISPFVATPVPTNVFTWLEPWYRDFQLWGVLVAVSVLGFLLGVTSRRSMRSPEALLFTGLLLGFSGLAGFNNRYGSTMSFLLYAVIWGLGRIRSGAKSRTVTKAMRPPSAGTALAEVPSATSVEAFGRQG